MAANAALSFSAQLFIPLKVLKPTDGVFEKNNYPITEAGNYLRFFRAILSHLGDIAGEITTDENFHYICKQRETPKVTVFLQFCCYFVVLTFRESKQYSEYQKII